MVIKLSQDDWLNFFSHIDTGHSLSTNSTCQSPFHFVDRKSKTLLVTVGDSWTWGVDILEGANDEYRVKNIYGNLISQHLCADWLLLAQSGSGNLWLARKVQEFNRMVNFLDYERVILICTFTESGRAAHAETEIDFVKFFKHNQPKDLLKFLDDIAMSWILDSTIDSRITLLIGRNFVDNWPLDTHALETPWYQLMQTNEKIHSMCHVVSPFVIDDLRELIDLAPKNTRNDILSMMSDLANTAIERANLLQSLPHIRNYHPNADGHRLWAEYVISKLSLISM
jgi:hypothetical protein